MVTLQDKLDNIYQTKLEIKSAIGTDSDVFSEYPAMIRSMAGGGVSYSYLDERLSYYVETEDLNTTLSYYVETSDLESMGYATETYVTNAIAAIPSVDLSSYVTYTYLESKQYLTEIPSTYATYDAIEAMGYITQQVLDSASYATESYVSEAIAAIPGVDTSSYVTYTYLGSCGYVTANDLPVVDENLIPKIAGTYTIGELEHWYKTAYISEFYGTNKIRCNLSDGIKFTDLYGYLRWRIDGDGHWIPGYNNSYNIGSDSYRVSSTYAYNTYTSEATYSNNYWTGYNTNIHSSSNYDMVFTVNTSRYQLTNNSFVHLDNSTTSSLGISSKPWAYTYTNNLYLNGSDINTIFPTYAYVAEHGGGGSTVIDENIVPKETATYTLGNSTYQYAATYTNNLYLGSYNITDMINGMFSYDTTTGTLTITTL